MEESVGRTQSEHRINQSGYFIYQLLGRRGGAYHGCMKILILLIVLAGLLVLRPAVGRARTEITTTIQPAKPAPGLPSELTDRLQDGDVIFIRVSNFIFRHVAETTDSWESHVGILLADTNGNWQVAESSFPHSKITPLAKFIARSEHGRFYITRSRQPLSSAEKLALRRAAGERMGIRYDLGFNYDSRRQYCSKFVHDVYQEATGVPIGSLTTFRQLLAVNPQAPMLFWRVWFCGFIPWDRRCVTTTSELKAQNFSLVYDSMKSVAK